jgi:hypothetical protein
VLAPAPDHFPNNIGLFFKFRAGAAAKCFVLLSRPSRESGTLGSCAPRFVGHHQNVGSRGCGFGLRREQNVRTMCGSHLHPLQPHIVLCFCNFKRCSLVHCRTVHVHVLYQISSRSPHRHFVQSSSIFRPFLIIPTFLATLILRLILLLEYY